MASAPSSCTTTFSRCAPGLGAKLTSRTTHLRPSRVPTTSTSWATTAGDRALGMALVSTRRRTTPSACNVRPRHAVDDDDSGAIGAGGGGLTLAEVVGVIIGNINNCDPGKLYGTITVTDGFGALQLYNRLKHNYQEVGPGGYAELAYPPRPILAADPFIIDVDLMDHYRWFPISDHKVAHGQVAWNSRDALPRDYNRILKGQVKAEYGEVEVQYAVLTDAVVAKVEVAVVESDNMRSTPMICGSVTATATLASGEQLRYSLFHKGPRECQKLSKDNKTIPLQRKLVSAPLFKKLQVSTNLWDANVMDVQGRYLDIVNDGSFVFTPSLAGTDSKTIRGHHGIVRVDVAWST